MLQMKIRLRQTTMTTGGPVLVRLGSPGTHLIRIDKAVKISVRLNLPVAYRPHLESLLRFLSAQHTSTPWLLACENDGTSFSRHDS